MAPRSAEHAFRQAVAHFQHGRLDQAAACCADAIAAAPAAADPHHLLGVVRARQGRNEEAVAALRRALGADPRSPDICRVLGIALFEIGQHDEALASFDRAVALRPDFAPALANRGDALRRLGRNAEAAASYRRALALAPEDGETLFNYGLVLDALGHRGEAAEAYGRVLAIRPDHRDALFNRANILRRVGRYEDALAGYDRVLALHPDDVDALFNRGLALYLAGRNDAALAAYDRVARLRPDDADVLNNRGNALRRLGRYDEALASYRHSLAIRPDHEHAFPSAAHLQRVMCDWNGIDDIEAALIARVRADGPAGEPFPLLSVTDDGALLLQAGRRYWRRRADAIVPPPPDPPRARADEKIRLGYLSGDFRLHAVAVQTAQMFDLHDRARFEVLAFSYGPEDGSELRRRLMAGFDEFHELRGRTAAEIARHIRDRQVDVLVDLSGYTTDGRPDILAWRPAPVQVHYLGYPGTMGTDAIDYMLVDRFLVPPGGERFFSEKLVYLPDCYAVCDRKRRIADSVPGRAECGLPEDGFVFCNFNNSYKITAAIFDIWARLLHAVPDSVLWLLGTSRWMEENLRREAAARGVDPARLVFAGRRPPAEHLARHSRADLFLDTLPYNAHSTASDALWSGVPLVTCTGQSFAARVAGSVLHAIGLPELVTESLAAYEALALALARDPERLAALRRRVADGIAAAPLFDSERVTRQIEQAYERMVEIWRAGLPPQSFAVG